ncbi:flagellar hook-basal body complex protein [Nocardioides sp.]|uniref:flagellar hook protein FlgE n=1 Tax=Nocardioides sp. TaxID=35761 RepID=UPI00262B9481|nr:flagellar hook-basal body complex protein [Nocardioides sp.]MDI6909287.1 flagellar hook-basal body complex protein [Nocardioides sp.]
MLRSLFAGISGLRVNQTMLDVTGNNIANANTIGFKSSSTVFQDTLSQMLTAGSAAGGGLGGTNPIQVGLGVQVAATNTNLNQGANQTTGRPTDLMINGDGMFVVMRGNETTYTRAGAFSWDNSGTLVSPGGGRVQGYTAWDPVTGLHTGALADIELPESYDRAADPTATPPVTAATFELSSYEIGRDGKLTATFEDGTKQVVAQVALANFNNPMGLARAGETSFTTTANSGGAELGVAGEGSRGVLSPGSVEMSNVDLAAEFTNLILAQRGFQASSRVITTSDQVLEDLVNIKR